MDIEKQYSTNREGNKNTNNTNDHHQQGLDDPSSNDRPASAHKIDCDSWEQVGLLLVTSFNCGYILSFSNLMLVPLGWSWGITCLIVFAFFTAYANWLLAGFHFIDGRRFIRYRDLMGFLFGKKMYYVTWILQSFTLLLLNMGFILLGGRALKEINSELSSNLTPMRLQYFIIITGAIYFIFSILVPTMSSMRRWLGISLFLTLTYISILLVFLLKHGTTNKNREYTIKGSKVDKFFNGFNAMAAIVVCNTSGVLPEIQATLRNPAAKNMRKGLIIQYSIGAAIYYGVSIIGYWAYGNLASDYLPKDLFAPRWAKLLINSAQFFQSIVTQHMFASPIHEALDTNFLKLEEKMNSIYNIKRRVILRIILFGANTFMTAAFPFMGDFVSLFGSFTLFPLTFVFPSLIFIKVKGNTSRIRQKVWHWGNIVVFSMIAVITTTSAIRSIINNLQIYNFFVDI